jgi:hypothetical protein
MGNKITYNGKTIVTPENGQIVTLPCAGKMMDGDVVVEISGITEDQLNELIADAMAQIPAVETMTFTLEG